MRPFLQNATGANDTECFGEKVQLLTEGSVLNRAPNDLVENQMAG
jgi:hypothetical protein